MGKVVRGPAERQSLYGETEDANSAKVSSTQFRPNLDTPYCATYHSNKSSQLSLALSNRMLLLSLLPLFAISALAAKKASPDAHDQLVALAAANNGVIKLDDDSFGLLTSPNRNWSAVVQLTALKAFKCAPCK